MNLYETFEFGNLLASYLWPSFDLEKGMKRDFSLTGDQSEIYPLDIRHYDPGWRYACMILGNAMSLIITYLYQIHALNNK